MPKWPMFKRWAPVWLKPPATLFFILFLLTLVSVSALAWFGWRLFEQERLVDTVLGFSRQNRRTG